MRKKLSVVKRMLAFVLTFAMAFTAISWGDVGEVKADVEETNLLTNGDFETGTLEGWTESIGDGVNISVASDQWSKINQSLSLKIEKGTVDGTYSLTQ
ncbi:MAG: hypothetical protein MSA09_07780, partial [Lachnospiraceae bacterium]|nr:hypothetical protein [Lachnospiraceae bacterium]